MVLNRTKRIRNIRQSSKGKKYIGKNITKHNKLLVDDFPDLYDEEKKRRLKEAIYV